MRMGLAPAALAIVAATALLFVALPADTSAQSTGTTDKKVIKIGTLLTDSNAHQDRLKAMELARDDFNSKTTDYTLELVNYRINPNGEGAEPQSSGRTGTQLGNAFAEDQITYFVGPMGSTDTRSAKAQLEEVLMPANPNTEFIVISPASTDPRLRIDDSVFRMVIDDSQQAVVLADYLESQGRTHVVMLGLNNSVQQDLRDNWSEGLEKEFRSNFGNQIYHITLVRDAGQDGVYDAVASELDATVSGLVDGYGADRVAVVAMVYAPDISKVVEAVNRDPSLAGLGAVAWYGTDGIAFRAEVTSDNKDVGTFLAGVGFVASQYAGEPSSVRDEVESRLRSDKGVTSTGSIYLYSSYDAVGILANAMAESDRSGNAKTVKQLLHELADGPLGTGALGDYGFNPEGDLDAPFNFRLGTVILDFDANPQWAAFPFNAAEKTWLASHPNISVGYADWPPFEYIDDNGMLAGVTGAVAERFSQITGSTFATAPTIDPAGSTWSQTLDGLKDGSIHVEFMIENTGLDDDARKGIAYTDVWHREPTNLIVKSADLNTITVDNFATKKIVTVDGYAINTWLDDRGIAYTPIGSTVDALRGVADGTYDVHIESWDVAFRVAAQNNIGGLEDAGPSGHAYLLSIGYEAKNRVLGSILQKTLGEIEEAELQKLVDDAVRLSNAEFSTTPRICR